jgi:hypothetical protein
MVWDATINLDLHARTDHVMWRAKRILNAGVLQRVRLSSRYIKRCLFSSLLHYLKQLNSSHAPTGVKMLLFRL